MQRYNINNRLAYLSGGVQSAGGMWPSVAAAADWWDIAGETCVAAYQPKGAASLAASYTNLANPGTYDAAPGTAPTWDSTNGWIFNGTTQYLTTGLEPGGGVVDARTWSAFVRFSDVSGQLDIFGVSQSGRRFAMQVNRTATATGFWNRGFALATTGALTAGVLGFAGTATYLDGSDLGATIVSPVNPITLEMYIGTWNIDGSTSTFAAVNIQAMAIYSTTLDATQVATLSSAMAAL